MRLAAMVFSTLAGFFLSGCAGLVFNSTEKEGALTYWDGAPYLLVTTAADCAATASVIMLPSEKRSVSLRSGYGSSELSLKLQNGMIAEVGQTVDTKVPETLTGIASLATALKPQSHGGLESKRCGTSVLYPIRNGVPDTRNPVPFNTAAR